MVKWLPHLTSLLRNIKVGRKAVGPRLLQDQSKGCNRHLSEVLSLILEPVGHAIGGCDIDSTGGLLHELEVLKNKLKNKTNLTPVPKASHHLDFAEIGMPTQDSSSREAAEIGKPTKDSSSRDAAGIHKTNHHLDIAEIGMPTQNSSSRDTAEICMSESVSKSSDSNQCVDSAEIGIPD